MPLLQGDKRSQKKQLIWSKQGGKKKTKTTNIEKKRRCSAAALSFSHLLRNGLSRQLFLKLCWSACEWTFMGKEGKGLWVTRWKFDPSVVSTPLLLRILWMSVPMKVTGFLILHWKNKCFQLLGKNPSASKARSKEFGFWWLSIFIWGFRCKCPISHQRISIFFPFWLSLKNQVCAGRSKFQGDWWPFSQSKHFPQAGLCQPLHD